jgi:Phosphoesterase family
MRTSTSRPWSAACGRRARRAVLLLALAGIVGTIALPGSSAAKGRPGNVPRFGHVFLIIGENTDYSHVDATNAPYLVSTLRPQSAWLESYYATTHWSQANYVALVTGQYTRCEQQDGGIACHQDVDSLYHRLDVSRQTWKVWLEAGTAKCDTGSGGSCTSNDPCPLTGFYTTGNPPILFDDIEGPGGIWSATTPSQECLDNDVPAGTATDGMATFNDALARGRVADFNMVIPNGCDDGEANCKPVNNRYTQFDDFLAQEVPLIEASPAFGRDGVIVVLYDEDERMGGLAAKNGFGQGGHTICAVISPLVVPGDYPDRTYAYSVLHTLQDGLGLPGYLGDAARVDGLPLLWK